MSFPEWINLVAKKKNPFLSKKLLKVWVTDIHWLPNRSMHVVDDILHMYEKNNLDIKKIPFNILSIWLREIIRLRMTTVTVYRNGGLSSEEQLAIFMEYLIWDLMYDRLSRGLTVEQLLLLDKDPLFSQWSRDRLIPEAYDSVIGYYFPVTSGYEVPWKDLIACNHKECKKRKQFLEVVEPDFITIRVPLDLWIKEILRFRSMSVARYRHDSGKRLSFEERLDIFFEYYISNSLYIYLIKDLNEEELIRLNKDPLVLKWSKDRLTPEEFDTALKTFLTGVSHFFLELPLVKHSSPKKVVDIDLENNSYLGLYNNKKSEKMKQFSEVVEPNFFTILSDIFDFNFYFFGFNFYFLDLIFLFSFLIIFFYFFFFKFLNKLKRWFFLTIDPLNFCFIYNFYWFI